MSTKSALSLAALAAAGALCATPPALAQINPARAELSGEQVYRKICVACHDSGAAGAPKTGDKAAWAPLIQEGQATLTGHAWVGVRAMPARGGSKDISLNEFSRAVAYMARAAGGTWADPDAKTLQAIARESDKRVSQAIREMNAMQKELRSIATPAR